MRALIRALERSVAQRVLEVEELTLALSTGGALFESTIECLTAALRDNCERFYFAQLLEMDSNG